MQKLRVIAVRCVLCLLAIVLGLELGLITGFVWDRYGVALITEPTVADASTDSPVQGEGQDEDRDQDQQQDQDNDNPDQPLVNAGVVRYLEAESINGASPAIYRPTMTAVAGLNDGERFVADCIDCSLFPVDKVYGLPASYAPRVVPTGLPGGGMLAPEAGAALAELFAAAQERGLSPRVNSSYRSYNDQLATYNYWVQQEINRGRSRAEAEREANRYSARPGHSEHQLGTTADINCFDCTAFDRNSSANNAIWKFIEDNAHKYGFVVSYPRNSEALTGYVYEPWHVRYVGVEIATDMYNSGYLSGNGIYLAQYLRARL